MGLYVVQGSRHSDSKGPVLAGIKLPLHHFLFCQRALQTHFLWGLLTRRRRVIEICVGLVLPQIVFLEGMI
ncbi:hypothetical protein DPMN_103028 [Dreissena polymorpha]|uniref:Uncharacterized protein n=1 Tax=Dreissena polymorpha TaxID=45954 RepID=A0A9D4HAD7_DREPO|nr:hypothetical protein DPMN_103028 [Dreissena polymorpha]